MVGVFRRSLSFPNKPTVRPPPPSKPRVSHHTRSISLPCRSHPLISHINHEISQIKSWSSSFDRRTTAWLTDGLSLLRDVQETLSDILHLPQSQESLRNRPVFFENLLEDLLRFVDAYGIFRTSVLSLREHQSAAQVALRRKDDVKISSYVKSRRALARDIAKLTSSIREPKTKYNRCHVDVLNGSYGEAELASVIGDVIEVTVLVSVALFNGVYLSIRSSKTTTFVGFLKRSEKRDKNCEAIEELKQVEEKSLVGLSKKKNEEVMILTKKMMELENSIVEIECGSEKVFRGLISTRVSLLNALTH
ncbi:hypothetical protein IGI04_028929 [Brassica rapa subsp. trilocularis]|uniref:DUF241 domain protein n=3 Tax=Brassica campestris TaxID=3711 RepID=A0A3P6BMU7_BRACM|nr:hypothetical protein IGI04_028929 [Brassica rapa subsp. trilocularis]VDD02234.1 unnamed protein product [Brassica rapa]